MTKPMRIDFVSDISCPWCVIGLKGLEQALRQVGELVEAEIHLQPFELNPDMPAEGQNVREHVEQKYGLARGDSNAIRDTIRARAADVGFVIATSEDSRIYNTFDAHRLLHWAETRGKALPLKTALFEAYFTMGWNPSDPEILLGAAGAVGLDVDEAREVLESGRYAEEVRAAEQLWQSRGIHSVPAVIFNERFLVSGGQPPAVFEQALRTVAAQG
jgi:predicted DsbA family dithiol-disulfide isomerase